jgi:hypothetical protein
MPHASQVVPFFFYRGLERLTYTWSDRAFQALFTVLYAGQWQVACCAQVARSGVLRGALKAVHWCRHAVAAILGVP